MWITRGDSDWVYSGENPEEVYPDIQWTSTNRQIYSRWKCRQRGRDTCSWIWENRHCCEDKSPELWEGHLQTAQRLRKLPEDPEDLSVWRSFWMESEVPLSISLSPCCRNHLMKTPRELCMPRWNTPGFRRQGLPLPPHCQEKYWTWRTANQKRTKRCTLRWVLFIPAP